MIQVSTRAADQLREELVRKCLDAGLGFRILINTDENGRISSSMKFDRQHQGDIVLDLGGVRIFSDPAEVEHVRNYHLDYQDLPDGGFFLVKRAVEAKVR